MNPNVGHSSPDTTGEVTSVNCECLAEVSRLAKRLAG